MPRPTSANWRGGRVTRLTRPGCPDASGSFPGGKDFVDLGVLIRLAQIDQPVPQPQDDMSGRQVCGGLQAVEKHPPAYRIIAQMTRYAA